ncbi:AAA family ATPase [Aeromicrobium sp. Leaf350]|uniref:AAA family ATPase n=1 Tax=Aeromicrobium sp. Leaf350 TaxID=2876565 RepID=UPI001E29A8B3|nr:SMC family ATPase [Aeromicrobium sp. Leaf350]
MRIHSVTMSGFGPYRDEVTVDFDAFADDGIFLLTGRTGAGKSSVLDALTYGLFGTVPRYGGKIDEEIRSRYLAPGVATEVTVELTVGETRYRVWRSPSFARPKKVGTGFTTQSARIELSREAAGGFEVFETKIGNAEAHVQQLLGIDAHQFLQVVLLAQGQFQEFLVAKSDTRRKLLRRLFGTQRFDTYAATVQDRARLAKQELEKVLTTIAAKAGTLAQQSGTEAPEVAGTTAWADQVVREQQRVLDEVTTRAEADRLHLATVEEAFQTARSTAERQDRRREAGARRTLLLEQQASVDLDRHVIAAARRAALAQQAVVRHRQATESAIAADQAHDIARTALEHRLPQQPSGLDELRERADQLAEHIGALSSAVELEGRLPDLRTRAAAAEEALTTFGHDIDHRRTEREHTVHRLDGIRAELESTADLGARHAATEAELQRLRERQARAAEADDLRQRLATSERQHLDLAETANEAERVVNALRRRQLDGYSAVLARELVPGEACLVCGATEHPLPAQPTDDHVEDSHVAAAEQTEADARSALSAASAGLERLRTSLQEAERQAAGTSTELTSSVDETTTALAELRLALSHRAALETESTTLRATLDQIDTHLAGIDAERERLGGIATAARTSLSDAEAVVTGARGEAASVEAVRASLRDDHAAVRALVAATERLEECRDAVAMTQTAIDEALADGGFSSPEEVEAAVEPAPEVDRLERVVAQHDAALLAAESTLAEPGLADLPDEPVDVDTPRAARDEARALATASGEERASQQGRLESYVALAAEITTAVAASAEQLTRYETVAALDQTLRGYGANQLRMPLETFALVAELEDILGAANLRLATMTGHRYELRYSDDAASAGTSGLEITVLDAHTGDTRSPSSLSGGEKFQASLALALGLAEVVTSRAGGLRLDTLFIDEGFGSLDPETLAVTMETLDSLREGGRTIGLISHVEAMKEQIPSQVHIELTADGSSTIRSIG